MTTKLPPTSPSSKPTEPVPSIRALIPHGLLYLTSTVTRVKRRGMKCSLPPESLNSALGLLDYEELQCDPPEEKESICFFFGTPIRTPSVFEQLYRTSSINAATRWEQEDSSRKR